MKLSNQDDTINLPLGMNFTEGMITPWDIGKKTLEENTAYASHAWVNQGLCCKTCANPFERMSTMIVCPECGDKRCPRAESHGNKCWYEHVGSEA